MKTNKHSKKARSGGNSLNPLAILATDFQRWQGLYEVQPDQTKKILDSQAQGLVQFLKSSSRHTSFFLPDQVQSKQKKSVSFGSEKIKRAENWKLARSFLAPVSHFASPESLG